MALRNEERVSATRGRLIDAAISALAEIGYHRTTFVEVSRRSELSRGAIHHHFASVPDLMSAVTLSISQRVKEDMNAGLATLPADADALDNVIDLVWQQMQKPPFRALNQIRGALANDAELKAAVKDDVSSVWEWMLVQARSILSRGTANPETGLTTAHSDIMGSALTELVLSSLCDTVAHDIALGAPPEDPDRSAYLAALKVMVRRFNSLPNSAAIERTPELAI